MPTPNSLFSAFHPIARDREEFTFRQLVILLHLHMQNGRVDFGTCAKKLKFPKPAATRAITNLVTNGWVERKRDEADKRFSWLSITPAGKAFVLKLCGVA